MYKKFVVIVQCVKNNFLVSQQSYVSIDYFYLILSEVMSYRNLCNKDIHNVLILYMCLLWNIGQFFVINTR